MASPDEPETAPQVWLLGSRYESAFMAAKMGLPFAYAHFFGMGATDGPQIVESYRQNFEASEHLDEPRVNVGVQVLCADTEEEARRIASSRNLGRLRSVTSRAKGIPSPEIAANYKYLTNEWQFIQQYMRNCVDGDPEQVKAGLEQVAEDYQTQDLSVVTICYHFEDRVRSYELVAEVCGAGNRWGKINRNPSEIRGPGAGFKPAPTRWLRRPDVSWVKVYSPLPFPITRATRQAWRRGRRSFRRRR